MRLQDGLVPPARSVVASSIVLAASGLTLLVGCATTAPAEGGGGDGGSEVAGGDAASSPNCDGVTTGGWELFVDPRLTVDPTADIVSLQNEGDVLAFTDTAPVGYTTYSYQLGYIDDSGSVFPNDAAIFVGAENTQQFQLEGPFAPSGVDGGPYAGIVQIEATNDEGITALARVCVLLATED